jgi:hypothetical protein
MPDTYVTVSLEDAALVFECGSCKSAIVIPTAAATRREAPYPPYPNANCAVCSDPLFPAERDSKAALDAYRTLCRAKASVRVPVK